jgi:hypothetical protein
MQHHIYPLFITMFLSDYNQQPYMVRIVMTSKHRAFEKNFETEIWVNSRKLPLNHFIQETVANMMIGFLKTLKEYDEPEKTIEIKIKKLTKSTTVDAHTYP